VESIDLAEKAIADLRRLGATIVDPGPGGALFQSCVDKYGPLYRSAMFFNQFPKLFPKEGGKPTADHVATLLDLWFNPDQVPNELSIRGLGQTPTDGESKYMLNRYLRERGDANIKNVEDLANKSTFFTDIRQDTGYGDRKKALLDTNTDQTLDMVNFFADRYAYQTIVLQCMAQQNLDAFVSPSGGVPAYVLGEPSEPNLNGRGNSVWPILGTKGFPMMNVPSGFTTNVWDRIRDASAPGGTRLVGPVPAKVPVGVTFYARPFDEPMLFRIASAYERATKHRVPPEAFGPVPPNRTQ
jgi:Asp-tRNA(Asn)/Glu-tRNA(Gln) amidotransferase A subunit family amidase